MLAQFCDTIFYSYLHMKFHKNIRFVQKKLHFIYTLFSNRIHSDVYVCISVNLYNMQKDAPKTK